MRAVSAITLASKGGPDGGISSEDTRGAIQLIISTGMARPSRTEMARQPVIRVSNLDGRGLVDLVDRSCQGRLKLGIAHRDPELFDESSRKARDHAVIGGEALTGDLSCISTGESDNSCYARVLYQRQIKIRNIRDRQLEHHL